MQIKAKTDRSINRQIYGLALAAILLVAGVFLAKAIEKKRTEQKFPKVYLSESERLSVFDQKTLIQLIESSGDNLLFLTVKDESSSKFGMSLKEKLRQRGGEEISQLGWRHSYVGVIKNGQFLEETRSNSEAVKIQHSGVTIESAGFGKGDYSKFTNEDQSISFSERGLNVVVVSPEGTVIASYNFDLFSSNQPEPVIRLYNAYFEELKTLSLKISKKSYEKLKAKRDAAVKIGVLLSESDDMVNAVFLEGGVSYPCEIRLKGDWTDHLVDDLWSFRVNLAKDQAWYGMQKFSLHHPKARNYLGEWMFHKMLAKEDILHLKYDFVQLELTIEDGMGQETKSLGLYAMEEFFTKQLIERNRRRAGILLKLDEDPMWQIRAEILEEGLPLGQLEAAEIFRQDDLSILPFGESAVRQDSNLMKQFRTAKALFSGYLKGDIPISDAFDIEKLATANVITNLLGADHALIPHNYRMYYNPINGRLEPVGFDGDSGRKNYYPHQYQHAIKDTNYIKAYVQAIERFTSDDYIREVKNWPGSKELQIILESSLYPYRWDTDFVDFNRKVLEAMIAPKNTINVFLESADKQGLTLSIDNIGRLPVQIKGISNLDGRSIASLTESINIFPTERKLIRFLYEENYERLFVNKKGRVIFDLNKEIENLKIDFRILGASEALRSTIYAWGAEDEEVVASSNFLRMESTIDEFDFLRVDEDKKTIFAESGTHQIKSPLILPSGYRFVVPPGTNFEFVTNGSRIISYAALDWRGTAQNPIRVYATTREGRGVLVMNTSDTSRLEHCFFDNLKNPTSPYWSVSGALNFYESDVVINRCVFKNNRCEDALNVIRADVQMSQSIFENIQSDAFDGDFVTGRISNTLFHNLGNDGVDVSGSVLSLIDLEFDKAGDKAISAGEDSKLLMERIVIKNSAIAIASKDNSYIEAVDIKLSKNELGFTAFQKKPEFGPASITAIRVVQDEQITLHLIEDGSKLYLNGDLMETQSRVKDQMYGVIYGKKSER